jgi:hypothetical protein
MFERVLILSVSAGHIRAAQVIEKVFHQLNGIANG